MNDKSKNIAKKGFSLVELAIVTLIIAIILAAVIKGKELISKSQHAKALRLTRDAPIHDLESSTLWLEAIDPMSFKESEHQNYLDLETAEQTLGIGSISKWYDRSPTMQPRKNAITASIAQSPKYYRNCINNISCLYFDGTQNYLTVENTNSLVLNDYSIFIVEKRDVSASGQLPILGSASYATQNESLEIGYLDSDTIYWNQGKSTYERQYDNSDLTLNKPVMHTFINATNANGGTSDLEYYLNTTLVATSNPGTLTTFTSTQLNSGIDIGKSSSTKYYYGNIGEIIILPFPVNETQRTYIQNYLLTKWSIN